MFIIICSSLCILRSPLGGAAEGMFGGGCTGCRDDDDDDPFSLGPAQAQALAQAQAQDEPSDEQISDALQGASLSLAEAVAQMHNLFCSGRLRHRSQPRCPSRPRARPRPRPRSLSSHLCPAAAAPSCLPPPLRLPPPAPRPAPRPAPPPAPRPAAGCHRSYPPPRRPPWTSDFAPRLDDVCPAVAAALAPTASAAAPAPARFAQPCPAKFSAPCPAHFSQPCPAKFSAPCLACFSQGCPSPPPLPLPLPCPAAASSPSCSTRPEATRRSTCARGGGAWVARSLSCTWSRTCAARPAARSLSWTTCHPAAQSACGVGGPAALGKKLLRAAQGGRAAEVRRLLDAGADPDFTYGSDWTALHGACRRARADVAGMLLRAGCCADAATANGATPLHVAAAHDYTGECAELLVAAGAALGEADRAGHTPLHLAALSGNAAVVRQLVAAGACRFPRNLLGETPLDLARTDCIRRLLLR